METSQLDLLLFKVEHGDDCGHIVGALAGAQHLLDQVLGGLARVT